jgi:hypothetical protein
VNATSADEFILQIRKDLAAFFGVPLDQVDGDLYCVKMMMV